jgi:hypothetical protein
VASGSSSRPDFDLAAVARITIPVHLLLPWLLWGLATAFPQAPVVFFVGVHVLFPVVLVGTYPLWRGQGIEVALLIGMNHGATLASAALVSLTGAAG